MYFCAIGPRRHDRRNELSTMLQLLIWYMCKLVICELFEDKFSIKYIFKYYSFSLGSVSMHINNYYYYYLYLWKIYAPHRHKQSHWKYSTTSSWVRAFDINLPKK